MNSRKPEVTIYQLTTHPLEKVLPRILEKVYNGGLRALVLTKTADQTATLNNALWTYSSGAFLPHGRDGDNGLDPADQPIWISAQPTNKNNATVLVLTNGQQVADLSSYTRCVDIFDGNDAAALAASEERRDIYQQTGHTVVYWRQSLDGNWDQVPGTTLEYVT